MLWSVSTGNNSLRYMHLVSKLGPGANEEEVAAKLRSNASTFQCDTAVHRPCCVMTSRRRRRWSILANNSSLPQHRRRRYRVRCFVSALRWSPELGPLKNFKIQFLTVAFHSMGWVVLAGAIIPFLFWGGVVGVFNFMVLARATNWP